MKIEVLDKGFIELMMCADTDLTVVNCARVSFGKESEWESEEYEGRCRFCGDNVSPGHRAACTRDLRADPCSPPRRKKLSARDTSLIHYLARENHWSPFAHPQIRLRFHAPVSIARQLFKHRFGGDPNEVSRRYVKDEPVVHSPTEWRGRPEGSIKQGSGDVLDSPELQEEYDKLTTASLELYNKMVGDKEDGGLEVAPEQARFVLPQGVYTEWIWTGSLAFFARIYKQRSDPHAQWEAQQYAKAIAEIVEPLFPVGWKALMGGEG